MGSLGGHDVAPAAPENEAVSRGNARDGLWLFAIYLALYVGFMLMNTFWADVMSRPILAGVNLAVLYGFGLIVAAFVVALVYGWLCSRRLRQAAEEK